MFYGLEEISGIATSNDLEIGFSEGWADYYAVKSKISQTSKLLHFPALAPKDASGKPNATIGSDNLATATGFGEDNELSVAEMLYRIDTVGVNLGEAYIVGSIPPYGAKGLFQLLVKTKSTDIAQFARRVLERHDQPRLPTK